jgi:hypothetical protein
MKRWQEFLLHAVLWLTVFPAMLIGFSLWLGMMEDGWVKYDQQRDACLKAATNGYEIRQCD